MSAHGKDQPDKRIYQEYGGEECVNRIASSLYARLVLDRKFGPVFDNPALDTTQLLRHQRNVISRALGGPCNHSLEELRERCADISTEFSLTGAHRDIMMKHLRETLLEMRFPTASLDKVLHVVAGSFHAFAES